MEVYKERRRASSCGFPEGAKSLLCRASGLAEDHGWLEKGVEGILFASQLFRTPCQGYQGRTYKVLRRELSTHYLQGVHRRLALFGRRNRAQAADKQTPGSFALSRLGRLGMTLTLPVECRMQEMSWDEVDPITVQPDDVALFPVDSNLETLLASCVGAKVGWQMFLQTDDISSLGKYPVVPEDGADEAHASRCEPWSFACTVSLLLLPPHCSFASVGVAVMRPHNFSRSPVCN